MASNVNTKIDELGSGTGTGTGTGVTVPLFENLGTPESIHTDEKVPGPGWIGVKLIESPVRLSIINRLWTKTVPLVKVKLPVRASASSKEASRTEKVKLERPETSVQMGQVPSVVNEPTPGTPPVKVASILKASAYANDAETATNATVITVLATWRWR
jgi:hypothetical protein